MKHEAIYKLYPNVVTIRGDEAFDIDGNNIAYNETDVQVEINANDYKEKRAQSYPSITDQLDILYHEGIDAWKAAITAVKQEYPKP